MFLCIPLCSRVVSECVTLVVKTRYRLELAADLIISLQKHYPNTRVLVADEIGSMNILRRNLLRPKKYLGFLVTRRV